MIYAYTYCFEMFRLYSLSICKNGSKGNNYTLRRAGLLKCAELVKACNALTLAFVAGECDDGEDDDDYDSR